MIVVAGGGEEGHTSQINGIAVGPWASASLVTLSGTAYTGTYSFTFSVSAQGSSNYVEDQDEAYYSFAHYASTWGNGTWRDVWALATAGGDTVYFRVIKGADTSHYKFQIVSTVGTTTCTNEASTGVWNLFKIQFDSGVWKVWKNYNGGGWDAIAAPELTKDDSGTYTELSSLQLSPNSGGDETKVVNKPLYVDDCMCWDAQGDNWNSLLEVNDFPRISEAHVPNDTGSSGNDDDEFVDEIPPASDFVEADDDNAYWPVEALKDVANGGSIPNDAYIQAVMVTRADLDLDGAEEDNAKKFNIYDGADEYLNSEEDGRMIQRGTDASANPWWTLAGYYPWTPDEANNWTQALFESHEYGCYVLDDITDQVTVQVIYFGDAFEWEAPGGAAGNVSKISTISWASVNKVSTIAEASINKVSTITAN